MGILHSKDGTDAPLSLDMYRKLKDAYDSNRPRVDDSEMVTLLQRVLQRETLVAQCVSALQQSELFAKCSQEELVDLAAKMQIQEYRRGDVIVRQGEPHDCMLLIAEGQIERLRQFHTQQDMPTTAAAPEPNLLDKRQRALRVEMGGPGYTIGCHYALQRTPAHAAAVCHTDTARVFKLETAQLESAMADNPRLMLHVVQSLNADVRHRIREVWGTGATPLLEHQQLKSKSPIFAPIAAASIEAFYRSALQGYLITRLAPGTQLVLFPNMQVQVPTRVVYITGLKQIRIAIEQNVDYTTYAMPDLARFAGACAPGIIMTPVSSILEACNVEKQNPEPLWKRWTRGLQMRCVREIVFAIGLNQLSDWCEERVPWTLSDTPAVRNLIGSMVAGVAAGYLSHVPHNLSTMKLIRPRESYAGLFAEFAKTMEPAVPRFVPHHQRASAARAVALIAPTGLSIRTAQIVGSFMILNGVINAVKDVDAQWFKSKFESMLPLKKSAPAAQTIPGGGGAGGDEPGGQAGRSILLRRLDSVATQAQAVSEESGTDVATAAAVQMTKRATASRKAQVREAMRQQAAADDSAGSPRALSPARSAAARVYGVAAARHACGGGIGGPGSGAGSGQLPHAFATSQRARAHSSLSPLVARTGLYGSAARGAADATRWPGVLGGQRVLSQARLAALRELQEQLDAPSLWDDPARANRTLREHGEPFTMDEVTVETMRSGGPGGQHANKSESAVRLTHVPSGVSVRCESQRSQHQNLREARALLAAKMRREAARAAAQRKASAHGALDDNAFGHHRRSWVLDPYTLVTDVRTGCKSARLVEMLDGGAALDEFIRRVIIAEEGGAEVAVADGDGEGQGRGGGGGD
eukprot:g2548.t1